MSDQNELSAGEKVFEEIVYSGAKIAVGKAAASLIPFAGALLNEGLDLARRLHDAREMDGAFNSLRARLAALEAPRVATAAVPMQSAYPRLSDEATSLLAATVRHANEKWFPALSIYEAMECVPLTVRQYQDAVEELAQYGLVRPDVILSSPCGIGRAWITPAGFVSGAAVALPSLSVADDIAAILVLLEEEREAQWRTPVRQIVDRTGIPADRLKYLLEYMEQTGHLKLWKGGGEAIGYSGAAIQPLGRAALRGA